MPIGADVVYNHDLYFDPADPSNGSLYLCAVPGTSNDRIEALIELLRNAALWSPQQYKCVPAEHKKNYAEQMQFIACAQFTLATTPFLVARFDHPKFPSDAERWSAWLALLAEKC
jgi:hypothetical protein